MAMIKKRHEKKNVALLSTHRAKEFTSLVRALACVHARKGSQTSGISVAEYLVYPRCMYIFELDTLSDRA